MLMIKPFLKIKDKSPPKYTDLNPIELLWNKLTLFLKFLIKNDKMIEILYLVMNHPTPEISQLIRNRGHHIRKNKIYN
ncbi:hypothetical protein BpHYR1_049479 [Brachionus plicatilis]|uniref:Uncharacterized protein n=1 Tax=Brachionus plicatilis TaxID=10195 RepID=A0A3M7RDP1_BRAPC|nr:hypothetical protein BpHYR1_049479 [Brachionus plicatilis]